MISVIAYLEGNNLFDSGTQYGFRKERSTKLALILLTIVGLLIYLLGTFLDVQLVTSDIGPVKLVPLRTQSCGRLVLV